jgi:two-component system chemotaxis sensor kinase CheA
MLTVDAFARLTDGAAEAFLAECDELLQSLDVAILRLEREPGSQPALQEIFRITHTVKSSAAAVGHQPMSHLAHSLENLLAELRTGATAMADGTVDLLLEARDALRAMAEEVRDRASGGIEPNDLIARLDALLPGRGAAAMPAIGRRLRVAVAFAADAAMPAVRALQTLMVLDRLGEVVSSKPSRAEVEAGQVERGISVVVATEAEAEELREALLALDEIESALVAEGRADASPAAAAAAATTPATIRSGKTVRVDVDHLEKLMNLVGELVIDRNILQNIVSRAEEASHDINFVDNLAETALHLERLTNELQTEVMKARMVPVEQVFNRFPRVVRDLARRLDKQIDFVVEGGETELDRSVIEEIAEPLVHLLRNAVDHGIESPAERVAAGKRANGTIRVAARHEAGQIVLEISDDGRGIDARRVLRAALDAGVVSDDESSRYEEEADAVNLVFAPGLSTAREISDVSGRGVGMDVVRTSLEKLGGSIAIATRVGGGTTFTIHLPLTLAIVHALLVSVDGATYALPLNAVVEIVRFEEATLRRINRRLIVNLRGALLPLVPLGALLRGEHDAVAWVPVDPDSAKRVVAVVVQHGNRQAGLIVDRLVGEQEIVIKPLNMPMGDAEGVAGAAVLGDGSIAPILSVPGLVQQLISPTRSATPLRAVV